MPVSDWSTSASSNTTVAGVNIAPGMARADVDNAIRGMMAELKTYFNSDVVPRVALASLPAVSVTAVKIAYLSDPGREGYFICRTGTPPSAPQLGRGMGWWRMPQPRGQSGCRGRRRGGEPAGGRPALVGGHAWAERGGGGNRPGRRRAGRPGHRRGLARAEAPPRLRLSQVAPLSARASTRGRTAPARAAGSNWR